MIRRHSVETAHTKRKSFSWRTREPWLNLLPREIERERECLPVTHFDPHHEVDAISDFWPKGNPYGINDSSALFVLHRPSNVSWTFVFSARKIDDELPVNYSPREICGSSVLPIDQEESSMEPKFQRDSGRRSWILESGNSREAGGTDEAACCNRERERERERGASCNARWTVKSSDGPLLLWFPNKKGKKKGDGKPL